MNIAIRAVIALATLCAVGAAQAETWTWIGGSTNGWSGGFVAGLNKQREWQEGYNWRDSNGVRGDDWYVSADHGYRPANGDTIIFDMDVKNEYTHCWGGNDGIKYAAIIVRGSNKTWSWFGSQPVLQGGGTIRLESATSQTFAYAMCKGTLTLYVADGGTLKFAYQKDSSTIRPIVKTGNGTWVINKGYVSFWTTLDFQGGTIKCEATNQLDNTSTSITFNGPNTILNLNGMNQNMKNAALLETAEATGHSIMSTTAACLTLSGTQDDTTFSGNITGAAGICWNPTDGTKTLTLAASTLDTTGTFIVSNGVLKIGTDLLYGAIIDLEGGKLEVSERNLAMPSGRVILNGAPVADGLYGPGTAWLSGTGWVQIGVAAGASATADWTGTGNMTVPANWDGAPALPEIGDGTTLMHVAGGASATVDTNAWVAGVDFASTVSAFTFLASGENKLRIGADGITTPGVGGTYSLEAPVELMGGQAWTVGANDTLKIKAPLSTMLNGFVTAGGSGTYVFEASSPDFMHSMDITSGTYQVKADYALGGARGTTSVTNASVTFYGTTQTRPLVFKNKTIYSGSKSTNVFLGPVSITVDGSVDNKGGKLVFAGGLEFGPNDTIAFNGAGETVVTNLPITGGSSRRHNFSNGKIHLYTPNNAINIAQQGMISGSSTILYTHVTNAIYSSLMNLAGNYAGGSTWDLCGCDQRVVNIQCGRGANGTGARADLWKTSTEPGTIRSDLPAVLHIADSGFSIRPNSNSSPSSTNWAHFVGQAGISKEGSYKSHWLLQECSSSGIVQVTQGELYIAKRFIDGAGNDYGQGSWPNASKAVAKGTGTLVFQHSACIGKVTDVEIHAGGKLRLEEGVRQVCRDLYLPDGNGDLVRQSLGDWGTTASGARHKNDTYFQGTGQLIVTGDGNGCLLIFR